MHRMRAHLLLGRQSSRMTGMSLVRAGEKLEEGLKQHGREGKPPSQPINP